MKLVFFGSFQYYSAKILEALCQTPEIEVVAVVTTTDSPVSALAKTHHLPVLTPTLLNDQSLTSLTSLLSQPCDFFVTAGFGKLLPPAWLNYPKAGSLNLHFSLLPKYRGANPAEWALLLDETQTGITLITMSQTFDTGHIIFQQALPINPHDTRVTLYERLYTLGAKKLPPWLTRYSDWLKKKDFACQTSLAPAPQPKVSPSPMAKRFKRDDGFIDWPLIQSALKGRQPDMSLLTGHLKTAYQASGSKKPLNFIARAARALDGFPSLWTKVSTPKGDKRLKLLSLTLKSPSLLTLTSVQLEGYNPSTFNQIKNQIHEI